MLAHLPVVAFVATLDAERSKRFYADVLGLRLVEDTPFAIVFDANGTTLRVQKARELSPAQHTALGWNVPDIHQVMQGLRERGVTFERYDFLSPDPDGAWTSPSGAIVAWFKDPDGNLLSLTQL